MPFLEDGPKDLQRQKEINARMRRERERSRQNHKRERAYRPVDEEDIGTTGR